MADHQRVGYGRPPEKTRFQKGKSGNPRGRPRQPPSFKSDLAAELQQTLAIMENGKRLTLTKQQAVFKMLTTAALKDVRAASILLDIARKCGVGTDREIPERDAEDDADLLNDFVQRQQRQQDRPSSDCKPRDPGDGDNG